MRDEKEKARQGELDGPNEDVVDIDNPDSLASPIEKKQESSEKSKPDPATILLSLPHTRAYLGRIKAVVQSQRVAVVKDMSGKYPKIIATIRFEKMKDGKRNKDGSWDVDAPIGFEPTEAEASVIKAELATVKWYEWSEFHGHFDKADLPFPYCDLNDDDLFICRSVNTIEGMERLKNDRRPPESFHPIIMIQARLKTKDGRKITPPLSWWSDDKWNVLEPDRKLPVFGMEQFADNFKEVMFLHEGPKSARAARRIVEAYDAWWDKNGHLPEGKRKAPEGDAAHPWAFDLAEGVHLGWIGGAARPWGTDWAELRDAAKKAGIERVVIVADNDQPGREALPKISEGLGMVTDHLVFSEAFPPAFDLADQFPMMKDEAITGDIEDLEAEATKKQRPQDITMKELLLPGTFMTFQSPNARGKPTVMLTEAGRAEFAYIPEHDIYVSVRHPRLSYDQKQLTGFLQPLARSERVGVLIQQAAYSTGRAMRLTYEPGKAPGVISDGDGVALNRHRPSKIRPQIGDASPWLAFMDYLFPDPNDRKFVERWAATLIARPDRKMIYALLLISEKHGVGKSTLGYILAELVGLHNTSYPRESDITSDYNEWMFEKRLSICSEIYSGHSWKAYNRLQELVTEPKVKMNEKFRRKIDIPNQTHIIACSNSRRALKLPDKDRRWLVPEVTEKPWTEKQFTDFRVWWKNGGLGIILNWAQKYGNYVRPGEIAPMTSTKKLVVAEGRPDGAKAVLRLIEVMGEPDENGKLDPIAVTLRSVRDYAKRANGGWLAETDQELMTLMMENSLERFNRIKVAKTLEVVFINGVAKEKLREDENQKKEEKELNAMVVNWVTSPYTILPLEM